jgi:CRISPR-associated protein Cas6
MASLDLSFPIHGTDALPSDHGYALYAAICHAIPVLHGAPWLGVHPIAGVPQSDGMLRLREHASLLLRLPAERIPDVLPLAGQVLDVVGHRIALGAPNVRALIPAASLDARVVLVKLTNAPHRENEQLGRESLDTGAFVVRYIAELTRQLSRLDIPCAPQLCGRRRITIDGRRIVGYSVRVSGLSAGQSLALQTHGLGGKRRMGCGIFRPTRGR